MNLCECGCGFPLPKARKRKRPTPRFIKGHNFRQRSLPDKACETCGKVYHALYADQRFCSQGCYAPSRSAGARKPRLERVCAVCGSTFSVKPYRSRAKFCSDACRLVRHPRRSKTCEFCSREFSTYDNHARYCSRSCARKDKVGEDATNWKGGVAAHRLRSQFGGDKLAKWRGAVYARDGYACQKCGATGALNAHHVKPLAEFPDLGLEVSNGMTLCVPCHEAVHGKKIRVPRPRCLGCGKVISAGAVRCRPCYDAFIHAAASASAALTRSGALPVDK